jgi:hypothetical protein
MTSLTCENNYKDTANEVFTFIENEIDNFIYVDIEEQIYGIIYYINLYFDYRLDIDAPEHTQFITILVDNCYNAIESLYYPTIQNGESEMSYIKELFEAKTITMITSIIKDYYEYHKIS